MKRLILAAALALIGEDVPIRIEALAVAAPAP